MRKFWFLLILLLAGIQLQAKDVRFVINAPATVVKDSQVQLQYILKNASGKDIQVPEDIKGFEVLYGPSVSTMHSTSIINGKSTSESSTTYTYLLLAKEEGTFTLPEARIVADGAHYKSGTKSIKVLPPDKNAQTQEPGRQPQATSQGSTGGKFDPKDAFIRAIFTKTKVKEQEAVLVTFRFYTVLNVVSFEKIEFPEFEGFMTEDIELSPSRQLELDRYQGRNYYATDVKKALLFPQRPGKLPIPAGKMDVTFEVPSGRRVNHPLFGPQEIMTEATHKLTTSLVNLNVEALPAGKPTSYMGGVGSFSIKSNISNTHVKANEAITLTLDITGTGNLKLIKNPEVEFDKNLEAYDPKIKNNFSVTSNGLTGTKSVEYLFIPRYPGKYTIPPVEFSYYDLASKAYKTLKTESYQLQVDVDPNAGKGSSATSYMNQQEVKVDQDIRYLKTGDFKFSDIKDFIISESTYMLWYIIPFILFAVLVFVYRNQIKANADMARMRTKKANKVATKRLRLAKKYLSVQNKEGFYEEVLRAVWGYLSDKLTISVAELSRENVDLELTKYGASESLIKDYISILDTCEFARYAPAESGKAMDKLYNDTVEAIGKMESTIKIK